MATKEENIQRLQVLAVQLGRDPDISGTAAEINQRLLEWEEEAASLSEEVVNDNPPVAISTSGEGVSADAPSLANWVTVIAVRTLHIHAIAIDNERELDMVQAGDIVRIPDGELDELLALGLVAKA